MISRRILHKRYGHRSILVSNRIHSLHTQASIVGAGLAGSLLAVYLRRRGYDVDVFEKLEDMRNCTTGGGRSINLILSSRGLHALDQVGLKEKVENITVPVYGRALHSVDGEVVIQRYGPDDTHFNLSVSRSELNETLISAAEEAGAKIHFNVDLSDIDLDSCTFSMHRRDEDTNERVVGDHIFGVDGANSAVRSAIVDLASDSQNDVIPLGTSYKELTLGLLEDGSEPLRTDMLHIWPRGSHFMMGLANQDGSMTMTLYLPDKGEFSVDALSESRSRVRDYFETFYSDVISMMPNYLDEYESNPDGFLGTLRCKPWHWKGNAVLLGDACHAITPFFGQGCNCSFEDVVSLDRQMEKEGGSGVVPKSKMRNVFEAYDLERKPNGDAIANLALDNYEEMSDRTADPKFILKKAIELRLSKTFPNMYVSRYSLVTQTLVPYRLCEEVSVIQDTILNKLSSGIESADDADLEMAEELIREMLVPLFEENGIDDLASIPRG